MSRNKGSFGRSDESSTSRSMQQMSSIAVPAFLPDLSITTTHHEAFCRSDVEATAASQPRSNAMASPPTGHVHISELFQKNEKREEHDAGQIPNSQMASSSSTFVDRKNAFDGDITNTDFRYTSESYLPSIKWDKYHILVDQGEQYIPSYGQNSESPPSQEHGQTSSQYIDPEKDPKPHNQREKKRRLLFKQKIAELSQLLPVNSGQTKRSQLDVISDASQLIQSLQCKVATYEGQSSDKQPNPPSPRYAQCSRLNPTPSFPNYIPEQLQYCRTSQTQPSTPPLNQNTNIPRPPLLQPTPSSQMQHLGSLSLQMTNSVRCTEQTPYNFDLPPPPPPLGNTSMNLAGQGQLSRQQGEQPSNVQLAYEMQAQLQQASNSRILRSFSPKVPSQVFYGAGMAPAGLQQGNYELPSQVESEQYTYNRSECDVQCWDVQAYPCAREITTVLHTPSISQQDWVYVNGAELVHGTAHSQHANTDSTMNMDDNQQPCIIQQKLRLQQRQMQLAQANAQGQKGAKAKPGEVVAKLGESEMSYEGQGYGGRDQVQPEKSSMDCLQQDLDEMNSLLSGETDDSVDDADTPDSLC